MARNEEKAQSMLSRFRAAKREEEEGPKQRRPWLASQCTDLGEAEKWRYGLVKQVGKKVAQIQNAGLGEFRIRDLNDEINQKLREKWHWEERIIQLGGPNYHKSGAAITDHEGKEVPGSRGYKYFGAAKDLPGVRELFAAQPEALPRRTKGDLFTYVDADYFGYRDEDDGVIVPLEAAEEEQAIARAVAEWQTKKANGELDNADEDETERPSLYQVEEDEREDDVMLVEQEPQVFKAHVPVPTQEEIEVLLMERQKQILMSKYASEDLIATEQATKELSGRK